MEAGLEPISTRHHVAPEFIANLHSAGCFGPGRMGTFRRESELAHELALFSRGGLETIRRNRPLVYSELGFNENRTVAFEMFAELDYKIGVLDGDKVVAFDESVHEKHNFFLSPVDLSAI